MGQKSKPQDCILDSLIHEDLDSLIKLLTCSVGREFLGGPLDEDVAEQRSKEWIDRSSSESIWAIRQSEGQEFLGYIILHDHHEGVDTEISYALLPEYWGRGYATSALLEAFTRCSRDLGMGELVAETQVKNDRSIKLLERLGMTEDRFLRRFNEDQVIYRIIFTSATNHLN